MWNLFKYLKIKQEKTIKEFYDQKHKEHLKLEKLFGINYNKPCYVIIGVNIFNNTQQKEIIRSLYECARKNSDGICMIECVNCVDKDNIDFSMLKRYYNDYKIRTFIKDIEYIGVIYSDYYYDYIILKCTPTTEIYNKLNNKNYVED